MSIDSLKYVATYCSYHQPTIFNSLQYQTCLKRCTDTGILLFCFSQILFSFILKCIFSALQERSQEFSKEAARQRENLSALRIIFRPCTPLQPFFLQGVCPGTLCTPPGALQNILNTQSR